ncbi:cystathionine beta-lyase family protein involved in aluminum resistance [Desulfitispora alkaliphila]|uniref:methionine gamma-lyase family protein n=1 Tax=Desulfitispora alkaliphila TaxID=622674 RepID=UPI003D227AA3
MNSDHFSIIVANALENTKKLSESLDTVALHNQKKVLTAFTQARVGYEHFQYSTGYGYGDLGRETLERIVAQVFNGEAALVRGQISSGTHAIACCLYGNLKPGDKLMSLAGAPYDTLAQVLGTTGGSNGSLADLGVHYSQIELQPDGCPDKEAIGERVAAERPKMVLIQRSRGYSWRPSISITEIEQIIKIVKGIDSRIICFVDNCYGEFVESKEPTQVGADLIAGSMIKNMGAGLIPTGGYIVGAEEYVEAAANRLTAPGIGSHVGATLIDPRIQYQGIFTAPHVTKQALLSAIYAASVFSQMGYEVSPGPQEKRTDIIQAIKLNTADKMQLFCRGLQAFSPIDSHVEPLPAPMAGYDDQVIMAGGTFVQGSSIELSADGPLRSPYAVYLQGGLAFEHSQLAINNAAAQLLK